MFIKNLIVTNFFNHLRISLYHTIWLLSTHIVTLLAIKNLLQIDALIELEKGN